MDLRLSRALGNLVSQSDKNMFATCNDDYLRKLQFSCAFITSHHHFSGSVALDSLPSDFIQMLGGTLDLTKLPLALNELNVSANRFHRETDFTKLPDSLKSLDVHDTRVSGTVEFRGKRTVLDGQGNMK